MTAERTSLADFLREVLAGITPLRPLDLELHDAHGSTLADDALAPGPLPPYDSAEIDGYALRADDLAGATEEEPVRISVLGDVTSASWQPARVSPGTCFAVAAGAPLPAGADAVIPPGWTERGRIAIDVPRTPARGLHVRRTGDVFGAGAVVARAGAEVTAPVVGLLATAGLRTVAVRPRPRVVVVATGDELAELGGSGARGGPGRVLDVNSHALTAAATEAGAQAFRAGFTEDDADALRKLLDDHAVRADLLVTTGGTGTGPGDMVRRTLGREQVRFPDLSLHPTPVLGVGTLGTAGDPDRAGGTPVVCLPGDPGAALVGFEILVRPVLQRLAGADPVFRPSVRAALLEAVTSPRDLREFRPAYVTERRGGGYTVAPLAAGSHLLAGLAEANGLLVLGEKVHTAPVGTMADVILFDRRR